MAPVVPCLWFDKNADEAVEHYLSIFPNSRRLSEQRYGREGPGVEGTTMVVIFELDGGRFMAVNGGPEFTFTPAVSFVVNCASQAEIDYYWDRLVEGGRAMQCGWLTDRFGLAWQIVPTRLGALMDGLDAEHAARVVRAMLAMVKLDVDALEAAARD